MAFDNSVIEGEFAGIYRNEDFFKYKTYEKNYILKFCGKHVWVKTDGEFLLIGDFERCTEKDFYSILKKLKKLAFFLGLPHLRYHCSPDVYFEPFFIPIATRLESTYPVGWVNFNSELELKNLKFTMCDNDTF